MNKFAPIMIPTLSRYEHLVECIASLKQNKWAKETELYISLDAPPSPKYEEGHKKIYEYLQNGIDGFKECHFFYQEENLGVMGNPFFLGAEISKKHDRYIFTEDDNVFAPCFLDYINKGLDLFENDERISFVCGYSTPNSIDFSESNVGKIAVLRPWGYGTWINKEAELHKKICRSQFKEWILNKDTFFYLYKENYDRCRDMFEAYMGGKDDISKETLVFEYDGDISPMEFTYGVVMAIENKYSVIPGRSFNMVRNCGYDGSGANGITVEAFEHKKQDILAEEEFNFECDVNNLPMGCLDVQRRKKRDWKTKRARVLRVVLMLFGRKFTRKLMNLDFKISHNFWRLRNKLKNS